MKNFDESIWLLVMERQEDIEGLHNYLGNTFRVRYTDNLKKAIGYLETIDFDLVIISDHIKGFDYVQQLTSRRRIPSITIVEEVYNSFNSSLLSIGLHDYLKRPYTQQEVLARIENMLIRVEGRKHAQINKNTLG